MHHSSTDRGGQPRSFNAVYLQNAVLCAECDCVSDSPNDSCLVCGSRSLFNISRVLGGSLPSDRTAVLERPSLQPLERVTEVVVNLPQFHRIRKRVAA